MSDLEPEWIEIIRAAIGRSLDGVHTGMPGAAKSYNRDTQRGVIIPGIAGIPDLPDVPVHCMGGAGGFLHFDLNEGDPGWIHFSEADFSAWRDSGIPGDPPMLLRHGLYAVFVPGLTTEANPLPLAALSGTVLGSRNGAVACFGTTHVSISASVIPMIGPTQADALVRESGLAPWLTAVEGILDGLLPGTGSTLNAARNNPALPFKTAALKSE
jgi:Phage protein Gp138 N-terminal domain